MKVDSLTITGFTGINNKFPADRIRTMPDDAGRVDLAAAVNFDLDDSGEPSVREGFALSSAFAGAHSGFAFDGKCYCVKSGVLYGFIPGVWNYEPLCGVGTDETMRYTAGAGRVFFTNGVVIGEIRDGAASLFGTTTVAYKAPLPAGQAIGHHKSRLYVGKDNVVWISDVKPLSRVDLRHGFKQFPDRVTVIAPGADGIYIGTEKAVYYGAGGNPLKMPMLKVANCGAKEIPVQYESATTFGLQLEGVFPVFVTDDSVCMGLPQGQLYNITDKRYVMPEGTTGASVLRNVNGQKHYIAAYR